MLDGLSDWDKGNLLNLSILLVVIVASSLTLRRANLGRSLKMAAAWIAIFAVIFVIGSYREDLMGHLSGQLDPASGSVKGGEFRIRAREDGHFWVRASVDGQPVTFLTDTGATSIVLSKAAAERAGIDTAHLRYDGMVVTANGAVRAATVQIANLGVGPIMRRDIRASVSDNDSESSLLGMAFLRTLKAWRVEGDTLVISL